MDKVVLEDELIVLGIEEFVGLLNCNALLLQLHSEFVDKIVCVVESLLILKATCNIEPI
jgi:hypothetical protein